MEENVIKEENAIKNARKPYWYKFYIGECPVCGRDHSFKERMYGDKPEDSKDRYVYLPDTFTYDDCL